MRDYFEVQLRSTSIVVAEPTAKRLWNVWHWYRSVGAATIAQATLMNDLFNPVQNAMVAAMNENTAMVGRDGRWIDDPTNPYVTNTLSAVGAITGDNLPSLNAVVQKFGTGVRGRSYHGRKYYGLVSEADTTGDKLQTTPLARWEAIATAYLAPVTDSSGNTWVPFLFSRKLTGYIVPGSVIRGAVITSSTTEPILGKLKRRQEPKR